MNWLNLHIPSTLRSPEYIGSTPEQRATWLSLMGYCAEQENGGTITGCCEWGDRRWEQSCGVNLKEISSPSGLWDYSPDRIAVKFYPVEKELEIKAKRISGAKGGAVVGPSKARFGNQNASKTQGELATETQAKRKQNASKTQQKEKEKEKEKGNGKVNIAPNGALTLAGEIYDLYPKRVGRPKAIQSILKAISKFGGDLVREKTAAYAKAVNGKEPQFIPHPTTWFNQERFNDDPSTWNTSNERNNGKPYSPGAISDYLTAGDGSEYVEAGKLL